jgi:hypothetical protein
MQRRFHWTATRCGCHERVVEDVYHTAATPVGLDSRVGPSSAAGMSSGAGHDDVPQFGLDTTTDILSQLEDALDTMQPSLGG